MASFYSNVTNEGDMLPTTYLLSQKHASHPSSELPNNKAYMSQPSFSVSYLNLLSGSSVLAHDHVDTKSIRRRDETMFVPPTGVPTGMQQNDRQLNFMSQFSEGDTVVANPYAFSKELVHGHSSEQHSQYHGLCLSLGSQEPSLVQSSSDLNHYTTSSLCSLLSSNVVQSEDQFSQNNGLKNVEYLSFDLSGRTHDTVKYEVVNNFQNLISSKETSSLTSLHQTPEFSGTFCNSKYLKAAQDLLDEVVNVHRILKQSEKGENNKSLGQDGSTGTDVKRDCCSSELHESTTNATLDLSPSERHGLQDKMTKLLSMLDEVDRRYKQYFHQMQIVVSSFDMVSGRGAAKPYSALALQTISRQFRSLRDAINKQIQATQKSLGEQDANTLGQGVLSRLRYVDQKLRQQKVVRQFGMRQPWRPQRGLPETAVSVLRAWLFEHFLHPYPKDAEKTVLARQAGLTRSQVANWFINARVRLWKPMIEDIYKEEFSDAETELKSSPERAVVTPELSAFDDREEEFQGSLMSAAADGNHWAHSSESRPDVFSSAKVDAGREELSYEAGAFQDNEVNCGLTHLQNKQILDVANRSGNGRGNDLIFDGTMGNQVSLALGLQHNEKDSQLISGGIQPQGKDAASSSMSLDKLEYYNVDTINHQLRFANPNLLSDFVAR